MARSRFLPALAAALAFTAAAAADVNVDFEGPRSFTVSEGDGIVPLTFTGTGLTGPLDVQLILFKRTQSSGWFMQFARTHTLTPSAPSVTFTIDVGNDTVFTGNRFFRASLNYPGMIGANREVNITVVDDEPNAGVYFVDKTVIEPSEDSAVQTVTMGLTATASADFTVTVTVRDAARTPNDGAASPADYALASATVSVSEGATSVEVPFTLFADELEESPETFEIRVAGASIPLHLNRPAWVTIFDDDARLRFTESHVSVFAGDDFTLELTLPWPAPAPSNTPVQVTVSPLYVASVPKGVTTFFTPISTSTLVRLRAAVPDEGTVTASVESLRLAPATAQIRVYGGALSIEPKQLTLAPGEARTVVLTMNPAPPEWIELPASQQTPGIVAADAIVSVAPNGRANFVVSGIAPGTTIIDVLSPGGRVIASLPVEVTRTIRITSVTPSSGTARGGTSVTIRGAEFAAPCSVRFGTTAASAVTFVDANTLVATTPAHPAAAADVRVTCGTSEAVLASAFTFTETSRVRSVRH